MEWKEIPILSIYEISNTGLIRNKISKRILKQQTYCAPGKHKHYDKRVRLYNNSIGKTYKVHRLMAISWFEDFDPNLEIDHLDRKSIK